MGTVLIPFQGVKGQSVVVEVSRAQWRDIAAQVRTEFERVDNLAESNAAILGIERHESVV